MKSALLSKIAMCVCPPVVVATSAVTVPPVKRAVHRLTAPHRAVARPVAHRAFSAAYDCTPAAVPITNLAPLGNAVVAPAETPVANAVIVPAQSGPVAAAQPISYPIAGAVTPIFPISITNTPINTGTSSLPEASTWAMTIGGFGAIGWAMRRKRAGQAASTIA